PDVSAGRESRESGPDALFVAASSGEQLRPVARRSPVLPRGSAGVRRRAPHHGTRLDRSARARGRPRGISGAVRPRGTIAELLGRGSHARGPSAGGARKARRRLVAG